jgi:hypothetical protein
MSCTSDFLNTNKHAGSADEQNASTYSATLQAALDTYNNAVLTNGTIPSCEGVTRGNQNPYGLLGQIITNINAKNTNLIDGCVNVDEPMNSIMNLTNNLEGNINQLADDEKTARLRVELLRSKDSTITNHQVFLLGRPLRPASIPFLWALSVLFIGIAVLIFYMFNPFELTPSNEIIFKAYLFIRNPIFIGAALATSTIAIILSVLFKVGIL